MPFDLAAMMASDEDHDHNQEDVPTYTQRKIAENFFDMEDKQRLNKAAAAAARGALLEDETTCNWRRGFPKTPLPDVPFDLGNEDNISHIICTSNDIAYPALFPVT